MVFGVPAPGFRCTYIVYYRACQSGHGVQGEIFTFAFLPQTYVMQAGLCSFCIVRLTILQ
jgi:hypothetical protein